MKATIKMVGSLMLTEVDGSPGELAELACLFLAGLEKESNRNCAERIRSGLCFSILNKAGQEDEKKAPARKKTSGKVGKVRRRR